MRRNGGALNEAPACRDRWGSGDQFPSGHAAVRVAGVTMEDTTRARRHGERSAERAELRATC